MLAGQSTAQIFNVLHSFTGGTNDGWYPSGLAVSGHRLYGTTLRGGGSVNGIVFALNIEGTGYTTLHTFTATDPNTLTNSDGAAPNGLLVCGSTLYGTTSGGGPSGNGTVFSMNSDGKGFSTLCHFKAGATNSSGVYTNSEGAFPSGLISSGDTLFGMTSGGGLGNGTLFAIHMDGAGFTNLHTFTGMDDGGDPGGLAVEGNALYGTVSSGGRYGYGSLFKVNTDGTGFTTLHAFTGFEDGGIPSDLVLSGNTLIGTVKHCFTNCLNPPCCNGSMAFSIQTDGAGFTHLYDNARNQMVGLILSGNTLYAADPGLVYYTHPFSYDDGKVLAVDINGTGFMTLHSFRTVFSLTNTDGAYPNGNLVLSGDTVYGTTVYGGSSAFGTVFSIVLPIASPPLDITLSASNCILSWSTNVPDVTLQSTFNLCPTVVWSTNLPTPVIVNGQYTVTNSASGAQQFFRLSR